MKTRIISFLTLSVFSLLIVSCNKDGRKVPVQILLTDNPTNYDAVNIHIKGMEVKVNNETWIAIEAKDTTVNLLDLQNGVTELIAQDEIPEGILKEVRFILDTDNTVEVNGATYPLETPSAGASGLKIKIDQTLNESLNTFILDFDAALSVKEENGSYKLYPVIKVKS
jgi:hypothetical protein